jgi:hypothetical protein
VQALDPATLNGLPRVIATERFTPYLAVCGGDPAQAIRLYSWNVEASAAFLGAYAVLEVGMRNAMHDALIAHAGQSDWWDALPLRDTERDAVDDAVNYLDRRNGTGNWTPGHLVAEFKASFWEGLLSNKNHALLWVPALTNAFPNYTGRRGDLRTRLERLRLLRNRAAHHEPIHARDLTVDHKYMCELAGFIAPSLQQWIATHSRLPSLVQHRADTVAGIRPTRF